MNKGIENQTATALKWLYEMEMVDNPTLKSNLLENLFLIDKSIKDCALFILPSFTHQKGILVYLKLSLWSKWFRKNEIKDRIIQMFNELLPSYSIRIVDNYNILTLAEERVRLVYGGFNETKTTDNDINDDTINSSVESKLQKSSDLLPNKEEQPKNANERSNESKQHNIQD